MRRPTCCASVRDDGLREALGRSLERLGWHVIARPTGFHVVEQLADAILERAPRPVELVVVDERAPGCRGSSIARGLRDLGIDVPVIVIAGPEAAPPESPDERIYVIEPEHAALAIRAIACRHHPLAHRDLAN